MHNIIVGGSINQILCSCGGKLKKDKTTEHEDKTYGCDKKGCCIEACKCNKCKTRIVIIYKNQHDSWW